MADIPYNSPKAICTASQIRSKLESKLKLRLGESKIVGPLDPYIRKMCEQGMIDEATRDELIKVSLYCEEVLLTSHMKEIPPFEQLVEWSKLIDTL